LSFNHFVIGPRYVFYRVAEWAEKQGDVLPVVTSLCITAALLGSNILFLYITATAFCGGGCISAIARFQSASHLTKRTVGIVLGLGLILSLYNRWIHSSRYTTFFETYRNESPQARKIGTRLVVVYVALSILVWVIWRTFN
jgi:hypothetical protein